jgi:cytochrome c peroxidase
MLCSRIARAVGAAAWLQAASCALACSPRGEARLTGLSTEDCFTELDGGTLDAQRTVPLDATPPEVREGDGATQAEAAVPDASRDGFSLELPPHFPRPKIPADNPLTAAKIELGRHLFHDVRLSRTDTFSCASCHKQELAFADERATGLGATGEHHSRGSMSLANVAYATTLTWGNPLMMTLEQQLLVPLLNDNPVELGMRSLAEVEEKLRAVDAYAPLFAAAFPGQTQPITVTNVQRALASFQRTLISADSPYDHFLRGDRGALSEAAQRGMRLVTTREDGRFVCVHCHGGFAFTDHVTSEGLPDLLPVYHQTGLYDTDGMGSYPAPNTGVHEVTLADQDMGKFKAPTLRNIALTAPYMHDGTIATLDEVLEHYARGGRAHHPGRTDPFLVPFEITPAERADIIAFLNSLTDETFIHDPRFANPWPKRR